MEEKGAFRMAELREGLAETFRELRAGKCQAAHANAIAHVGRSILHSVKLEMEYHRFIGEKPAEQRPRMEIFERRQIAG